MSQEETKHITVSEFRFWLEGVEEMQLEDWTPDPRQWKRIRGKINQILDTPIGYPAPAQQGPTVAYRTPAYDAPIHMVPGGLSDNPPPMPIIAQPPANSHLFANADANKIAVKTPNIDTSMGNYESSFT